MKKILSAIVVVVGAASFWAFGGSPKYYQNEIREPMTVYIEKNATKVFIGDTGKDSPQRDAILDSLKKDCEESPNGFYLFILGDYGYPKGINSDKEFSEHVEPFLSLCENHISTLGIPGNHEKYKIFPNGYMAKRFHGKVPPVEVWGGFIQENYYYKVQEISLDDKEIGDCFLLVDSSPWDSPFSSGIKDRITAWIKEESKTCEVKNFLSHHYFFSSSERKPSKTWFRFYERVVRALGFKRVISGHDHLIHYTVKDEIEHYISGMGSKTTKNPVGYLKAMGNKYDFKILGNNYDIEEEDDD